MKLKRNVVMLPTNEKAVEKEDIVLNYPHSMFIATNNMRPNSLIADYYKSQHLYITSDKEIKEGDWCIQNDNYLCKITCNQDRTQQGLKKIIATTDKSLGLPTVSDGFIKKFIERYNAGNPITEVMVEYEEYPITTYGMSDGEPETDTRLKVDKDNCITIKAVKESWTREEVSTIIHNICGTMYKANTLYAPHTVQKWIDQNL